MAIRGKTIFCQYSTHQELKTIRKLPTKSGSILGPAELAPQATALLAPINEIATSSSDSLVCFSINKNLYLIL